MKIIKYVGLALYGLTLVTSVITLLIDPVGLNVRSFILPLIIILFLSSLGFGNSIASKKSSKTMTFLGTILLAILFAMLAFLVIATVAWLVAVSHT